MSHFNRILLLISGMFCFILMSSWGFFAHKRINYQAVFSLPEPMMPFYKKNIVYLSEHAVDPDKRRYIVKSEACKHYIDLDHYPQIVEQGEMSYLKATQQYSEDSIQRHGSLPWNILLHMKWLEQAFLERNMEKIVKYSADLGHYIGDAHVPLHTTSNYNGQYTQQHGIHGLWESRLPELYYKQYDLWVGQAQYLQSPYDSIWKRIFESHQYVNKVLRAEWETSQNIPDHKKYSIHYKNGQPIKTYSPLFCEHYQKRLGNMVEERLRKSIKLTADCWYTCWINAGKPELPMFETTLPHKKEKKEEHSAFEDCIH